VSASDEPRCSICGGAHREVDWHVKEEAKAREYFAGLVTRAEIARVNNAMYEQPVLAPVLAAVLAEVATVPELTHLQALSLMDTKSRRIYYADDSARVGHAFPDERWNEENEWRDIAAIAIQQMLRLRTEGA